MTTTKTEDVEATVIGKFKQAGTVSLRSARGKRLDVRVSTLGRVRICAPADAMSPAGYAPC